MADPWPRCLAFILRMEGGWSEHVSDPGGATNMGITLGTFTRWRQQAGRPTPSKEDLRNITLAEVESIYKKWYWQASGADMMPWPMCLAHVDLAINGGPGRAAQALAAVGLNFDAYQSWRLAWYKTLTTWPTFGLGWTRRVNALIAEAKIPIEETDMANPLHANCQGFKTDSNGMVTGIELGITKVLNAQYEVYSVRMLDEHEANGQTVAACSVLDRNGINTGQQVRLTWPGVTVPFQDSGLPGNPNNTHVIINGFSPPKLGPLAMHVGGFNAPISDIVYGFGLPYNRHVSFSVVFREKGSGVPPVDPTDPTTDARIVNLETWARAVSAKYPQGPQYV